MQASKTYSFSAIEAFKQCKRKYYYRYIQNIEEVKGEALLRGIKVHEDIENGVKTKDTEEALKEVNKMKKSKIDIEMRGKKHRVHLNSKHPFLVFKEEKWGLSQEWQPCEFDDPKAIMHGVADYVKAFIDKQAMISDTSSVLKMENYITKLEVIDWKTGKKNDSKGKKQLSLYAFYYFSLFPNLTEIQATLFYVDVEEDKRKKEFVFTREDIKDLPKEYESRIQEIESCKTFTCCRTPLCNYCSYKKQCDQDNGLNNQSNELVQETNIDDLFKDMGA